MPYFAVFTNQLIITFTKLELHALHTCTIETVKILKNSFGRLKSLRSWKVFGVYF